MAPKPKSGGNAQSSIVAQSSTAGTAVSESDRAAVSAAVLQLSVSRNLSDKLYEKRKLGALEVEQLMRELRHAQDWSRVESVIGHLVTTFSDSAQGNARKGGLIALAATAIGLGEDIERFLDQLVPPVLRCFRDQDSKIRYYACESLYNLAKIARHRILRFYNEIFDALCKLAADPDASVRNGAQLLDRLIKDIVTEHPDVLAASINEFIPLLAERVYVLNPHCRSFLVAWVAALDSVPEVHLLQYLPRFADGIFAMLCDPSRDIRTEAHTCLSEFLGEISEQFDKGLLHVASSVPVFDLAGMVRILITHANTQDSARGDDYTALTALQWITAFLGTAVRFENSASGELKDSDANTPAKVLLPFADELLSVVLPSVAHNHRDIQEAAAAANAALGALVTGSTVGDNAPSATRVVTEADDEVAAKLLDVTLSHITTQQDAKERSVVKEPMSPGRRKPVTSDEQKDITRLAALRWVLVLHAHRPAVLEANIADKVVPTLLELFSEPGAKSTPGIPALGSPAPAAPRKTVSESSMRLALDVLASVSGQSDEHFDTLTIALVRMFRRNRGLLERRGVLIITHLCELLSPQRIFVALARILADMVPLTPRKGGKAKDSGDNARGMADSHSLEFVTTMVRTLNLILLTSPAVYDLRVALRSIESFETIALRSEGDSKEAIAKAETGMELFTTLFRAWSHSAASAFSLCLLSRLQHHRAAAELVSEFGELEVTVPFLLECDKIVSLLESPVFVDLRLQLVDPSSHPYLFKALFGLLALLPQSAAFHTLQTRLHASAVAAPTLLTLPARQAETGSKKSGKSDKKVEERVATGAARDAEVVRNLLGHFHETQEVQNRMRQKKRVDGQKIQREESSK